MLLKDLRHDVVNLFYAIKTTAETHFLKVQENRLPSLSDRLLCAEAGLKKIQEDAGKALSLTREIGRLGMRPRRRNFPSLPGRRALVQEIWPQVKEMLAGTVSIENIEFLERIPERFPRMACRPDELFAILKQLAVNAVQAMEGKGKLVLRTQISFNSREDAFGMITLADTGPGIPETMMGCLFKPFFSTKPQDQGNGLGLYLISELVRNNNGRITVTSYEGFGTAFQLEFPLS